MTGTSSSTQKQTSQVDPYPPAVGGLTGAIGGLTGLLGNAGLTPDQSAAINTLTNNGKSGDPNAGAVNSGVQGLLSGGGAKSYDPQISQNLTNYQGLLNSTASGANIGKNSALQPQLNQVATDVTNQVNPQFAAMGRDGSPANSMALGRGIGAAEFPIIAGQYNTDVANQLGAASSLYNAGNQTYGILNGNNQTANANIGAGIAADPAAYTARNAGANSVLAAQSNIFGIPASQYQTLLGSISPVAQAFGQQNGTASGTNTMSGAQQFGMLAQGANNLVNPMKYAFG